MENQHRHIKGYRVLSAHEIALMNRIKEHEAVTLLLVREVQSHVANTAPSGIPISPDGVVDECAAQEYERFHNAEPGRWAAIAKTDFQTGFMALVRAVAQPATP